MKLGILGFLGISVVAFTCLFGTAQVLAQNAYITNEGSNTVSVIDTTTNAVIGVPISVGECPFGVAVAPNGKTVYVTNTCGFSGTISAINTATNSVTSITGFKSPAGVAAAPDGRKVYVGNQNISTVSVIDTTTNAVISSITGFLTPAGGGSHPG